MDVCMPVGKVSMSKKITKTYTYLSTVQYKRPIIYIESIYIYTWPGDEAKMSVVTAGHHKA